MLYWSPTLVPGTALCGGKENEQEAAGLVGIAWVVWRGCVRLYISLPVPVTPRLRPKIPALFRI